MTTTATPPTAQEPPKGGDAAHHSHALADDTMERNDEGSRRWPSITDASASSRTPTAPSHCVVGDVVTPNMLSASKGWLRYVAHSCGDDEVDTAAIPRLAFRDAVEEAAEAAAEETEEA